MNIQYSPFKVVPSIISSLLKRKIQYKVKPCMKAMNIFSNEMISQKRFIKILFKIFGTIHYTQNTHWNQTKTTILWWYFNDLLYKYFLSHLRTWWYFCFDWSSRAATEIKWSLCYLCWLPQVFVNYFSFLSVHFLRSSIRVMPFIVITLVRLSIRCWSISF